MCRCNQTLNLLSRLEYFRLSTSIADDQLILDKLFTAPHTLTLIRSNDNVPTLTLAMIKGPVDLTAIRITGKTGEFRAIVNMTDPSNPAATKIETFQSTGGVINQCILRVNKITLEFAKLPVSSSKQDIQIDLPACEHTLRKYHRCSHPRTRIRLICSSLACNCTPIYDIMRDSSYVRRFEVSEPKEQQTNLLAMMKQNHKTGFTFPASSFVQHFRVFFTQQIYIAMVQVITPRSNVKQIRLSYLNENNETIKSVELQNWPVQHISDVGRVNNTLDKLCPNFPYYGIRVDLLQTDSNAGVANNATLKVFVRQCQGPGGRIRK